MILLIIKIMLLLIAFFFTLLHTYKAMLKDSIDAGWLIIQAICITAFITLQWLI